MFSFIPFKDNYWFLRYNRSRAGNLVGIEHRYAEDIDVSLHQYPAYGRDLIEVLIIDVDAAIFGRDRSGEEIKQSGRPLVVTGVYRNYHCFLVLFWVERSGRMS